MKTVLIHDKEVKLSERQLEVLQLIVKGYTNSKIADELCISLSTTKVHVRSLMNKLEANHRTQLVAIAIRHEIVDEY